MSDNSYYNKQRPLYRSRSGLILGVCKGLAQHAELQVFWVRFAVLILLFFTGFWPIFIMYFAAGLFMRPEPVVELNSEDDAEFYNSFASDRHMALSRIKRKFDNLERRARRLESIVVNREFDWDNRMKTSS